MSSNHFSVASATGSSFFSSAASVAGSASANGLTSSCSFFLKSPLSLSPSFASLRDSFYLLAQAAVTPHAFLPNSAVFTAATLEPAAMAAPA